MGCLTHAGIDVARKHYVLVKSRQHFRAGFEAIAKHIVLVDGPGVCSSDYSQFDFKRVQRPIYPLDVDMEFEVAQSWNLVSTIVRISGFQCPMARVSARAHGCQ